VSVVKALAPFQSWHREAMRLPVVSSRYALGAIRRAARLVAEAAPGARNSTLNCEAYSLGRLVVAGVLARRDVVDALLSAGRMSGLRDGELLATVNGALDARIGAK
jgi:hypothetical protein